MHDENLTFISERQTHLDDTNKSVSPKSEIRKPKLETISKFEFAKIKIHPACADRRQACRLEVSTTDGFCHNPSGFRSITRLLEDGVSFQPFGISTMSGSGLKPVPATAIVLSRTVMSSTLSWR